MELKKMVSVSFRLLVTGILLFSVVYPLMVGGIGQLWGFQSRGSQIEYEGEIIGSRLIGQKFSEPHYFQGRPSSIDYQASTSGSANLGPNNPELADRVELALEELSSYPLTENQIPADLVTESGSALDPHISPEAAYLQVPRIAEEAGLEEEQLNDIIDEEKTPRFLGLYGRSTVNVLELNLRLKEEVLN
ncbi:MAG: potassium-transporting ATPase subunit KdpC [Bacillota bacterium]